MRSDLKGKIVILAYVREPFKVESRDKPGKCSGPRTRELFRLVTASTVSIHSFETITSCPILHHDFKRASLRIFKLAYCVFLMTAC